MPPTKQATLAKLLPKASWISELGFRILDLEFWILGLGSWILGLRSRILNISSLGYIGSWNYNLEYRVMGFRRKRLGLVIHHELSMGQSRQKGKTRPYDALRAIAKFPIIRCEPSMGQFRQRVILDLGYWIYWVLDILGR